MDIEPTPKFHTTLVPKKQLSRKLLNIDKHMILDFFNRKKKYKKKDKHEFRSPPSFFFSSSLFFFSISLFITKSFMLKKEGD